MKTSQLKQWLYLGMGTAVTIILLSWALRDVSIAAVWQALRRAQWQWLLVGWLAYLAAYWVRAWRWGTLLAASGNPGRFQSRLAATFIGFGASSLLPGHAGEVIRAVLPARLDKISVEASFGSIVAERILDLGVVFLFLLLPISFNALPQQALQGLPLGWIGAVIGLIWLILIVLASIPAAVTRLVRLGCSRLGLKAFEAQIAASLKHFLGGLTALRQPQRTGIALLQTLVVWLLNALTYWTGMLAFGIQTPGLWGAFWTQSTAALAIALPSTPGYIGSFEAGIRFSLNFFSIPVDIIIAYAIALRFLMYVTTPIIALIITARLGFAQLRSDGNAGERPAS